MNETERRAAAHRVAVRDASCLALAGYLAGTTAKAVIDRLLTDLVRLTESELGLVRLVRYTTAGVPFLSTRNVSSVELDRASGRIELDAAAGTVLSPFRSLFSRVMTTGELVTRSMDEATDTDEQLPPGVHHLMALALSHEASINAIIALANRADGYDTEVIATLEPVLTTAALLLAIDQKRELGRTAAEKLRSEQLAQSDDRREEAEQLASAMLRTALDGIIAIDQRGRIVEWNPAAERLFGHARESVLGRPFADTIVPNEGDREPFRATLERLLESGEVDGAEQQVDLVATRGDGTELPCRLTANPVAVGGRIWTMAVVRDRSQSVVVDDALRRAKEDAEASNRAKTQFLATVSHEIRTPLNAVVGMSELMLDSALSDEQSGWMKTIQSSADTLLYLVNDLLDLSKIEVGQLDIEQAPFSVPELVDNVIGFFRQRARAKGLALTAQVAPEVPAFVVSDANRLRQVLLNLVGNAIKFTATGSVTLTVQTLPIDEPRLVRLRCRVEDTGTGIAPEYHASIFERFYQVDGSNTRSIGGTGLGLAICSSLLALMGGRLELERSRPGEGSVFAFTLDVPVATPAEAAVTGAWSKPSTARADSVTLSSTGGHVLVAEDNRDSRALVQRFLTRAGFEVDAVADGEEAVDKACSIPYDLILMDVEMPLLDGLEATRRIRAYEQEHELDPAPIVALTAHALEGYRQRCLGAGMDDYLSKPIRRQSLLDLIARRLDQRPLIVVLDEVYESRLVLQRFVSRDGDYRVVTPATRALALDLLGRRRFDLVLVDIDSVSDGMVLLGEIRAVERQVGVAIAVVTSDAGPDALRRCHEAGCDQVLTKPVRPAIVLAAIARLLPGTHIEPVANAVDSTLQVDPVATDPVATDPVATDPAVTEPRGSEPGPPILVRVDPEIADLIPDYLTSRRRDVELLRAALAADDLQAMRILGHNLKGNAGAYGFHDLGGLGRRLEEAATAGDRVALRHTLATLDDYITRLRVSPPDSS